MRDDTPQPASELLPPAVLVAVGALAAESVEAIPAALREIALEVRCETGVVFVEPGGGGDGADGDCNEVRFTSLRFLSPDVHLRPGADGAVRVDDPAFVGKLAQRCTGLRQEAAHRMAAAPPGGSLKLRGYVLVDLTAPACVSRFVQVCRALRTVEPLADVTAVALTGSVSETLGVAPPSRGRLDELLRQLQDAQTESGSLVQRVYILDGRNTADGWIQTLDEMRLQCARFLVHHGFSPYRRHIRGNELTRASVNHDLAQCIGSFAVRVVHANMALLRERLAAHLAAADLAPFDQERLTDADVRRVDRALKDLASALRAAAPSQGASLAAAAAAAESSHLAAVRKAVEETCSQNPVPSLLHFCSLLRPLHEQLLMADGLRRRIADRYRAVAAMSAPPVARSAPAADWEPEPELPPELPPVAPAPQRREVRSKLGVALGILIMLAAAVAAIAAAAGTKFGGLNAAAAAGGVVGLVVVMISSRRRPLPVAQAAVAAPPPNPAPARSPMRPRRGAPLAVPAPVAPPASATDVESRPVVSRGIAALEWLGAWHARVADGGSVAGIGAAAWGSSGRPAVLLDVVSRNWEAVLAGAVRRWLSADGRSDGDDQPPADEPSGDQSPPSSSPLFRLARGPGAWADCVIHALESKRDVAAPPTHLLVLDQLRRWPPADAEAGAGWQAILGMVEPDRTALESYVMTALAPYWPVPSAPPSHAVVIAAGSDAWPALARIKAAIGSDYLIQSIPWRNPATLVIFRIVQGAARYWGRVAAAGGGGGRPDEADVLPQNQRAPIDAQ